MMSILIFFENIYWSLLSLVLGVFKFQKDKRKETTALDIVGLELNKNIALLTNDRKTVTDFKVECRKHQEEKHLVVLVCWMGAEKKHIYKFAKIWIDKGFDVLTVTTHAWHLLWPLLGSQTVAADVLKFLDRNDCYSQIMVHGFSVGGYHWGEVLVHMSKNLNRYQRIVDKIVGQVWDSIADVEEIPGGLPTALFPENKFLATALNKYMLFHLKVFDRIATRHYVKSSQIFHSNMVKAPGLIFLSKTDPIGHVVTNQRLRDHWESGGIRVHWKLFETSPHVEHFRRHPEEYIAHLNSFLDTLNFSDHTID